MEEEKAVGSWKKEFSSFLQRIRCASALCSTYPQSDVRRRRDKVGTEDMFTKKMVFKPESEWVMFKDERIVPAT